MLMKEQHTRDNKKINLPIQLFAKVREEQEEEKTNGGQKSKVDDEGMKRLLDSIRSQGLLFGPE